MYRQTVSLGIVLILLTASLGLVGLSQAQSVASPGGAVSTAFTYQGTLSDGGHPANGFYDLLFTLHDAASEGSQLGVMTFADVPVADGLFRVDLDFGDQFDGTALWLQVAVRPSSGGAFTILSPRQALTATPYALHSRGAPWSGLSGVPPGLADGLDDDTLAGLGCSSGEVPRWNGTVWICSDAAGGGPFWSLHGNAGTDQATHFLGTSDAANLTLAVNGSAALRIEPAAASPNLIGGHGGNQVIAGVHGAAIGGGGESGSANRVTDHFGTVGGGSKNQSGDNNAVANTASYATVGGGYANTSSYIYTTVGGGHGNTASGAYGVVAGGQNNAATNYHSSIGGGQGHTASGAYATVAGGYNNTAAGPGAFVGGGGFDGDFSRGNQALGPASTIGGGIRNVISATAHHAAVGGGGYNTASGLYTTIAGGWNQSASGAYATVSGGGGHTASGPYATIGGGLSNLADDYYSTIAGGLKNSAINLSYGATIAGGTYNTTTHIYGTVGGGSGNLAGSDYATVGGGRDNAASGGYVTIGGGRGNTAAGGYFYGTIAGGYGNSVRGSRASVGGGESNVASGSYATSPGGYYNTAQGDYSFAAGRHAKANSRGCFVWADSTPANMTCSSSNRTIFRNSGGFYIYTSGGLSSGMYLSAGGSSWNAVSDRARKENLQPVDGGALLENLAAIDISTWNYTAQDPSIRHVGPMAQDFNALLPGLGGEGEAYINSLDADGVALAAIQGLYELSQQQADRIDEMEATNLQLHSQLDDLTTRLNTLEHALSSGAEPVRRPSPNSALRHLWPGAGLLVLAAAGVWGARRRGGRP